MPKNILQDVVPRDGRRSIRQIPLSREGHKEDNRHAEHAEKYEEPVSEVEYSHVEEDTIRWRDDSRGPSSRWMLWAIGVVCAGFLVFVLGNFFSGATVSITPKTHVVVVNQNFTAKPNAPAGTFSYTPYSLVKDMKVSVPADGEKFIETRSSGKIIVYNNYSTAAQRLVKNTRFETPEGLIYKIADSITIPGRHTVGGQVVPGSLEVTVSAESTGPDYNIGLTDFTIPGFKSNPSRYSAFYARSRTPMTGGGSGMQKYVSDAKLAETKSKLDAALRDELLAETKVKVPSDSIFYSSAYKISFEPVASTSAAVANQANVTVSERARFTAYFVKHADLAQAIAGNLLSDFDGASVLLQGDDKLSFNMINKGVTGATSIGPIDFTLKGNAVVIWQVDKNKIAADLAGKNKSDLPSVVAGYPAVLKAEAVIRPFWKSVFPKSPDSITVNVESMN